MPLETLLKDPSAIAGKIIRKLKPLPLFKKYLQNGYFPFSKEDMNAEYAIKLNQVINTILESDLAIIENYSAGNVVSVKKLLGVISESVPFTPNISALASKMKLGRDTVNNFLLHLERARMLNLLHQHTKGVAALQKPDKIYLENTNLNFALKEKPDTGSLRETFFLNQLRSAGYEVTLPKTGDFLINGKWLFEVGARNKDDRQLKSKKNTFLAVDDIEAPYLNRIPLWMFGLLY